MDLSGSIDNSDIECSGASNVYIIGGNYTDCVVDNSGASDVDMEEVRMKNLRISLVRPISMLTERLTIWT